MGWGRREGVLGAGEPGPLASDPVFADEKVRRGIDVESMRGIEIGALHNPRLPRHPNLKYLDHASRDELVEKYRNNPDSAPQAHKLVDVDYVWRPGQTLAQTIGADLPIDFVVASHVIEHIPNPIGWLQQVSEVLAPGGVLSLVVPDMRYTFDARRPLTPPARLLDAYLRGLDVPSAEQIFDHESGFLGDVDAAGLWKGDFDLDTMRRTDVADPDVFAWERCLASRDSGEYVDVHCTTFTPLSFLDLLDLLVRLDLCSLVLEEFSPTELGHYEFFATLRRAPASSPPDVSARQRAAIARFRTATLAFEAEVGARLDDPDSDGVAGVPMIVSPLEQRLVRGKRALVTVARHAVGRIRRLRPTA